jgi:hypothetical protein
MTYQGLRGNSNAIESHLGGNVIEGDPFTYAPTVWTYLVKRFSIRSVLDIGSGIGYSSEYFSNLGCKVIAVDGLADNCDKSVYPTLKVDISKEAIYTKVDLVHCQEVVEHIEELYLENLLKSMTCGKYIVMTNALPGQGGYHHVNEQPTEYWISHLKKHNCEVLVEDSNRIRRIAAQDGATYLAKTGLVLTNYNR